jgi:predicted ribosomally synthesized peptide with SipW-like signal peptide
VIDIDQLWGSGVQAIEAIRDSAPEAQVVVLGAHDRQPYGEGILSAGASAYVPKWKVPSDLSSALAGLLDAEKGEASRSRRIAGRSALSRGKRGGTGARSWAGLSMLGGPLTGQKVLVSAMLLALVASLVGAGLAALFRDVERSSRNTFTAGTLDLSIDGGNPLASAKLSVSNLRPGDERRLVWQLCNRGTLDGYVDLQDITVTSYENGCLEPELDAEDATCGSPGQGEGELQDLIGLDLFWDYDCDGSYDPDERRIYQQSEGPAGDIGSSYDEDEPLEPGNCICIAARFEWSPAASYGDDNLGQGDSMELILTFQLSQEAGQ